MSRKNLILALLGSVIMLASCSKGVTPISNTKVTQNRVPPSSPSENSDAIMKIEGLVYNLNSRLAEFDPHAVEVSSCPIYLPGNLEIRTDNHRLYDVSDESAGGEFTIPKQVAFCDIDYEDEKYVLILASFANSGDVSKAIREAFELDGQRYLYLGLPTGLILESTNPLVNLEIHTSSVSTDDCIPGDSEFSDSNCPTGRASYFRAENFLLVLSERVVEGYTPSSLEKYSVESILKTLY